jgi:hypothetical protein
LDQVWIKNVDLVRAVLTEEMLEWSDHRLIKLVVGAEVPHRRDNPRGQAAEPVAIPLSAFPQSNIKKIMSDPDTLKHIEGVDVRLQPIICGVPEDIVSRYAPKSQPQKPQVRYCKSKQQAKQSGDLEIKGAFNNEGMMSDLKRHYDNHDMK